MKSHCPTSEMQITTWYTVRKIMCNAELHSKNHPYAILSWTLYFIFGLKISLGQALCVLCFLFAVPPTQNTQKACPRLSLDRKRVKIIIWLFLFHHGASYGVGWHVPLTPTQKNWGLCVSDFRYLNPGAPKLKGEFSSAHLKMGNLCRYRVNEFGTIF